MSKRVRSKCSNGRPALALSTLDGQDYNVRPGEVFSIVCPDCQTWRLLMGKTRHKIRRHCASDQLDDCRTHERCPGSFQVVVIDIPVRAWKSRQDRLLNDAMPAENRRPARQHYKPVLEPPTPLTKMGTTARAAFASYRIHVDGCPDCTRSRHCPIGEQRVRLHARLKRLESLRDLASQLITRQAVRDAAATWAKETRTTNSSGVLAKRSGTDLEERNNQARNDATSAITDYRGPGLPTAKIC